MSLEQHRLGILPSELQPCIRSSKFLEPDDNTNARSLSTYVISPEANITIPFRGVDQGSDSSSYRERYAVYPLLLCRRRNSSLLCSNSRYKLARPNSMLEWSLATSMGGLEKMSDSPSSIPIVIVFVFVAVPIHLGLIRHPKRIPHVSAFPPFPSLACSSSSLARAMRSTITSTRLPTCTSKGVCIHTKERLWPKRDDGKGERDHDLDLDPNSWDWDRVAVLPPATLPVPGLFEVGAFFTNKTGLQATA